MLVINRNNKLYKRALIRESKVWEKASTKMNFESIEFLPHKFIFLNKTIEIGSNSDWLDIISLVGYFEKGLILGGGNADFENYLIKKGTVLSFENMDIIFNRKDYINNTQVYADLNFVELKENYYDIIVAKSILHHIINLEHLLLQVNKSLKRDGIFVVVEYIGENKQQWRDNKIDFINKILMKFDLRISRGLFDNFVPFESIRSEEIPEIIDKIFGRTKILEQKWDYIYSCSKLGLSYNQIRNLNVPKDNFNKEVEETIVDFESEAKERGLIPTMLFGLYKKTLTQSIEIKEWDKPKIKKEFELNFSNLHLSKLKKLRLMIKDYYNYLNYKFKCVF